MRSLSIFFETVFVELHSPKNVQSRDLSFFQKEKAILEKIKKQEEKLRELQRQKEELLKEIEDTAHASDISPEQLMLEEPLPVASLAEKLAAFEGSLSESLLHLITSGVISIRKGSPDLFLSGVLDVVFDQSIGRLDKKKENWILQFTLSQIKLDIPRGLPRG